MCGCARLTLAVVVLVGVAMVTPVADADDPGPQVRYFAVPTAGPGSLTLVVVQGLAPNETTQLTMVDVSNPSSTFAMTPLISSKFGAVVSPTGYRTPDDVIPGTYHLEVQQASGLTATSSSSVTISPPAVTASGASGPGGPLFLDMTGLSGDPSIARSATVDGEPVPLSTPSESLQMINDQVLGHTAVSATLPGTLLPGRHTLSFTQAAAPAVTLSVSFQLGPPSLFVGSDQSSDAKDGLGSRDTVGVLGYGFGPGGATASVRGADGRVRSLPDLDGRGGATAVLPGLPPGPAVFTATGKSNGVSASTTLTVVPSTLASPSEVGNSLVSPSGDVVLFGIWYAGVVLLVDGRTTWSAPIYPTGWFDRLVIQSDGNLVAYASNNQALWNTRTKTKDLPTHLTVTDDGRAILTTAHGGVLWATPTTATTTLSAGATLRPGARLQNLRNALVMQSDGNVVLYGGQSVLFQTHTAGHPGSVLRIQSDGNLVLYSVAGKALWSDRVFCGNNARLVLQGDANLVEYAPNGKAVWSTRTAGR